MSDIFSKKKRSEIMSRISGKNTKPEVLVFSYLRKNRTYFRKHYRYGRVTIDVAAPAKKIAVFIDGDFWHGWHFSAWRLKLPKIYWRDKITANIKRDRRNIAMLRRHGWRVLRVWEHQLKRHPSESLERIRLFLLDS